MSELSRLRGSEGCAACSDEVMAHWPTGSAQTDRIRLPYTAPEASRRAFFVKELSSCLSERRGKERES